MKNEDAVSPVVGVMLMLVVTIIIAAVVSGFAGGLIGSQEKSPTLSMDVTIANTGSYVGSGFTASVFGVSEPISTSDLKVVTSWSTTMKDNTDPGLTEQQKTISNGDIFTGGNTSLPNSANVICYVGMRTNEVTNWSSAPYGMGAGIDQTNPTDPFGSDADADQKTGWFGQYTLREGVNIFAYPYGSNSGEAIGGKLSTPAESGYNGATPYAYKCVSGGYEEGQADPTQAVLGYGWEQLRAGDTVSLKVIYTPTGAAIYSANIAVED
ncbi:type IV pilin [Methanolacinia paynteri]|uniref:type IV pilin n=1 Tax=Methanolacinia paynteri TaxID=230356 RepID=UPI0006947593|nr:type IV pilin N-terminal domain-containing protein [Methanolacinia paynteri]